MSADPRVRTARQATVVETLVREGLRRADERGHMFVPSSREGHQPCRVTIVNRRAVAGTCEGFHHRGSCGHVSEFNNVAERVDARSAG